MDDRGGGKGGKAQMCMLITLRSFGKGTLVVMRLVCRGVGTRRATVAELGWADVPMV